MHLSRREAMRLLGTGAASAGLGLTAACRSGGVPEAESEPPPGRAAVVFPEGSEPVVSLLYRPGHYDVLYPKEEALGS